MTSCSVSTGCPPTTSEPRKQLVASKEAGDSLSPQSPFHSGRARPGSWLAWRRFRLVEQANFPPLGFEHSPPLGSLPAWRCFQLVEQANFPRPGLEYSPRLDSAQRQQCAPEALQADSPARSSERGEQHY